MRVHILNTWPKNCSTSLRRNNLIKTIKFRFTSFLDIVEVQKDSEYSNTWLSIDMMINIVIMALK